MGGPRKLQPLDYATPIPKTGPSTARYVIAIVLALFVVPVVWFIIGECIIEPMMLPQEPEPLTGILMVVAGIISIGFGVLVYRAITEIPKTNIK